MKKQRAKSNTLEKMRQPIWLLVYRVVFSTSVLFTSFTQAAPSGANVISGNVDVKQSSTLTTINQHTNTAIIDWQRFGIRRGETVEFVQLNSNSIALNRVVGLERSVIDGALRANGKVFIINRRGILFGKNARVNVGGLVATTSDISNANFLNRLYKFNKPSKIKKASVVNRGNITIKDAGLAILVAPSVENHGKIVARLGKVVLGSANSFTLDLYGDELISFDVTKKVTNGHVKNTGTISANGGQVLISAQAARNAVDDVISLGGLVEAKAIGAYKGQVILAGSQQGIVNITGKIDVSGKAKGQKGGSVHITSNKIGMAKTAVVDARGYSGGGQIRIGKTAVTSIKSTTKNNPRIMAKPTKPVTTKAPVDPFYADALAVLNGAAKNTKTKNSAKGKKADINADFFYMAQQALLDASATQTGNGGEVIIHSKEASRIHGNIKATGGAKSGNGGFVETSANKFLNVTNAPDVSATKGKGGTWLLDPNNIEIVESGGDTDSYTNNNGKYSSSIKNSIIDVSVIKKTLNSAGQVIIETGEGGEASEGNIILSTALDYGASNGVLTLNAHKNIIINGEINPDSNGSLDLILNANKDGNNDGNVYINRNIDLNGGDLGVRNAVDFISDGSITAGSIEINVINDIDLLGYSRSTTGRQAYIAENNITTQSLTAKNDISVKAIKGSVDIVGDVRAISGNIKLFANTNKLIRVKGNIEASDGSVVIGAESDKASFDLGGGIIARKYIEINRDLTGADIRLDSENKVTLQAVNISGDLGVTARRGIELNAGITTHGNIRLDGDVNIADGASLGSNGAFTIASNGGDIYFNSINGQFALELNAAKNEYSGGYINGDANVLSLRLAGAGGKLTGTVKGSILPIWGYYFGRFYFDRKVSDFAIDISIIQDRATSKTVLNDKLFTVGISEGNLNENLVATDAKLTESDNLLAECNSKKTSDIIDWSLLGVKENKNTKDKCGS